MQNINTAKATIAALKIALRNAVPRGVVTDDDTPNEGVFIGYGGLEVEDARLAIPAALQAVNAENINWGNLHTTDGSVDTVVRFTVQGNKHYVTTVYGA